MLDQVFVNTIAFKQVIREGKSVPTFPYYQKKGKVKLSGQACSITYYQGPLCSKNSSGKISSLVL